jgi:hypothetical protein
MNKESQRKQWIKTGAIGGLLGGGLYFAAAFIPMPDLLVYISAFAFGPLLAIGCTGLYYFLSATDESPRLQIAVVSAIAGGITLLLMLTVQQSVFSVIEKTPATSSAEIKTVGERINKGLNNVQLGMDIAWDVLICTATILFGYSMMKKTGFWRIIGFIGLALGFLLLGFNMYYFPKPPDSVGSIDWGPFVAIWYLVVSIILLTKKGLLSTSTLSANKT